MASIPEEVGLPIPIFLDGSNYYVFSVAHAAYLRAQHRVAGVLIGTLPQSPQQNVFLGLPVQLMAEEARLLVEQRVCFVVDDASRHRDDLGRFGRSSNEADRLSWDKLVHEMGLEAARIRDSVSKDRMERALGKMDSVKREQALKSLAIRQQAETLPAPSEAASNDDSLFSVDDDSASAASSAQARRQNETLGAASPMPVTPTTSWALSSTDRFEVTTLPPATKSYPLYAHLHNLEGSGYFISPGLRFGCEYLVYPGDPLRFHSHFLAVARDWDEEFDLLSLIGGGRLGTGVKKGFLLGGRVGPASPETASTSALASQEKQEVEADGTVRCFCIEWGGM